MVGVMLVMVGELSMVKVCGLLAVPAVVVTETGPVVAPAGTVTVNRFAVAAVTVAVTPLNLTVLLAGVELNP
jgi:hypothetical protein